MPSLIEGTDRQTVKRAVPKASNKIHAVAIAKLYVAYPDKNRWTYTGLQGAIVLADDLVGNTFWLKLVDISPANRGVIWDQEIYDTFSYNQDRIFFHTFELEDCLAGLSFADDKEAKTFKKKMDDREGNAHKNTSRKPFSVSAAGNSGGGNSQPIESVPVAEKSHSRLGGFGGGFGNLLHRGHRSTSAQQQGPMQSIIPPANVTVNTNASTRGSRPDPAALTNIDPTLLDELLAMGLTEDQLRENADFIRVYVEQRKSTADAQERRSKAAPPPPPSPPQTLTPQDTGSASRRSHPPPAPPPARRSTQRSDLQRPPSPDSAGDDENAGALVVRSSSPPPAAPVNRFRAPPPIADAGKFANDRPVPPSPTRARDTSTTVPHPGPPPPPRASQTPAEDSRPSTRSVPPPGQFAVPPPFPGGRAAPPTPSRVAVPPAPPARGSVPPPPPARGSVPPPPPARGTNAGPPLPPKTPLGVPPPPARDTRSVPLAPAFPSRSTPVPPPPPMPSTGGVPPPPPPPPPGPAPSFGGPPAPPPPPPAPGMPPGGNAPPLPNPPAGGHGGLLADIRGGARLKKVPNAAKNDRSAAAVPGAAAAASSAGGTSGTATPAADSGGLAGALASALAARKSKVSHSDDEDDHEDW